MSSKPQPLGLRRSFGFGDRLGLATPGHIDAVRGTSFAPIFAQQSIRELKRTQREPEDVMHAAVAGVEQEGWRDAWGADADHLQTREGVLRMARAGFCFFTIDPSAYVNDTASMLEGEALASAFEEIVRSGLVQKDALFDLYAGKKYDLAPAGTVTFNTGNLTRAAVKYGAALAFARRMADWIREASGSSPYEMELSVDETSTPTAPEEHLYIGLELKRLGVKVVSLAPRFYGDFEKGIDYKGNLAAFENSYRLHVAIARYCGPYKLSIHSGSDKFLIYPVIGRLSGEHLHVKTAGTSYLEALRVVCRVDKKLFRELIVFCREHYQADKKSYHVSAQLKQVPGNIDDGELEKWYLEDTAGRQILHVTFGSVLAGGRSASGIVFKDAILETLGKFGDLYREVLCNHLRRHLSLLAG